MNACLFGGPGRFNFLVAATVDATLPKAACSRESTNKQKSVVCDRTSLTADPKLKRSLRRRGLEITQTAFPVQVAALELTDIGLDSWLRIRGLLIRV